MKNASFKTLTAVIGLLLCLLATAGRAAEQKPQEVQKAPAAQAPAAIPVANVTARATEVSNLLRNLYAEVAPSREIEKIQRDLPEISARMAKELVRTEQNLQTQPTMEMLQTEQQLWQKSQLDMGRWLNLVTQRATQLETALNQVAQLHKVWTQTLDAARAEQAPKTTIQQISEVLSAIEAAQATLQTQRNAVLDLQGRFGSVVAQCGKVLAEIAQAQHAAVGGLASRGRLPIWDARRWASLPTRGFARLHELSAAPWADIQQYLHDPSRGMPVHLGFFIVLLALFHGMKREVRRWAPEAVPPVISSVSERPLAAALIASLLFASSPYSAAPPTVRDLFEALAIAPIIWLMKQTVDQRVIFGLNALGILFILDTARVALAGTTLLDQVLVVLEALAGMAVLGWSLSYGKLQRSLTHAPGSVRPRAMRLAAILVLAILGVGLVTGIVGYMRVARLLVSCVIIGGALALALFASVKILLAVAAFGLRVWPLRLLHMVRHHRDLLERRTHRVLIWLAIAGWLARVLDYLGLLDPTLSAGTALLAIKLERGSIHVTLEDILAFVLAVWGAYLFSAFIRFVLEEDVYPRRRVPQGMAYAASRLLHYIILALGFVVGMGVLGVDLTKVTVLVGAFGVGLGFGLQSVVNNFVSGLILLFERPIHVGDAVEVGNLQARVQRIGIRVSVVRTSHGAEIIVPNSQLVSEQVTNWTLSDQLRASGLDGCI
jgi:potassium efflux system protein